MIIEPDNFDAQYQMAEVYRMDQKHELAESKSSKLIKDFAKDWRSYNLKATLLIDSGKFKEAIPFLDSALQLTPENEFILNNLGVAYLYLGDYLKSAQYFENGVEIIPTGNGYSNAASIYYCAGDFEKARDMYTQARSLLPDYYPISLNLADTYRQIGDQIERMEVLYREVVEKAQSKIDLKPSDGKAYQALALAFLYLGDEKMSLKSFKKAVEFSRDNDPELYYSSAKVYVYLGKNELAQSQIQTLISLGYPATLINADPDLMLENANAEEI